MEPRISLITLGVRDLERARVFYEALGFPTGAAPGDDVVFFRTGGTLLAHNVRSPAEVDAVVEDARAAGANIVREPGETFWGGYDAIFTDPDGHPWEVAHNPRWTIREDGSVELPA
jgi:uncharacterized protein